ncbi:hypothetical protein GUJ93_ZPchr0015g6838 [Zizania palustris]|uniref:Uncharacterized protein n=1 Tax=Zizania palustris TaxID=103762 RepID=A0A8J5W651_ZIZPA|nr:hypothetical protein GUJ93_ZPchr0015g6838 [Zizania palustris]
MMSPIFTLISTTIELPYLSNNQDNILKLAKQQRATEKYNQVAVAIEMLLNLNTMSIEELVGQLHVAEDRYGIKEVVNGVG